MLNTQALMSRLGGKLSLPSLPEVVLRVQAMASKPSSSVKEVGMLIAQDPPLTARVLRIANSAYYSLSAPVLDICHGAAILGLDTLQSVVLQVGVVDLFKHLGTSGAFKPAELWQHSILTAKLAGSFPKGATGGVTPSEAYVAGLLHDVGKFVMFESLRDEYADAFLVSVGQKRPMWEVEQELFQFDHAQVGELVTRRWGLPDKAVRAVGQHHRADLTEREGPLVALVAAANHLANGTFGSKTGELREPMPKALVDRLGLSESAIEMLVEKSFEFQGE